MRRLSAVSDVRPSQRLNVLSSGTLAAFLLRNGRLVTEGAVDSKTNLLERYRRHAEQNEFVSTVNYLQLRNLDLLREWRTKLALSTLQNGTARPVMPPAPT